MAAFSQLCERVNYEGCWKYWSRGPQVRSDKTALVSSPITTGIRLMSLLTAIPAAKLWCQQMASISQITFVVSEEVGSNTEQAPSHRIFSIGKNRILKSSNHGGNAEKMNGMRIDISRWGLGGCGWGGVPARQNPHWGKTIGGGRKNWRLKGGRTFVSAPCHKSGPYLPFGKPWTSLWGAISFGQHFQATTEAAATTVLRSCLDKLELPHLADISCNSRLSRPSWLNCQVSQNIGASAAAERRRQQHKKWSDRKISEKAQYLNRIFGHSPFLFCTLFFFCGQRKNFMVSSGQI